MSVPLLGITLEDKLYLDIAPPFGCRTLALVCARTTRALVWLLRREGYFSLCYLDDFVGIDAMEEKAYQAYTRFTKLASILGLELDHNKCTPTAAVWLGFSMNTVEMTVLPSDKLEIINKKWKTKCTTSRKQIQSIASKLQHVMKCVKPV